MTIPTTSSDPNASRSLAALSFEEILEELESVTRQIESREIGIETATDLYERAGLLHAAATDRLASVEARIKAIDDARGGAAESR
jgi:exodeoxyribonuclease VII small subunit